MTYFLACVCGVLIYAIFCAVIAAIRALCAKSGARKRAFAGTFGNFFLETLNPFHWLS